MKKLSLNNKHIKVFLITLTVISCLTGIVGAFFKVQPVYYTGMGLMGIFLIFNVIAFINAAKEDKLEEIEERYKEATKDVVFTDTDEKKDESPESSYNAEEAAEPDSDPPEISSDDSKEETEENK